MHAQIVQTYGDNRERSLYTRYTVGWNGKKVPLQRVYGRRIRLIVVFAALLINRSVKYAIPDDDCMQT